MSINQDRDPSLELRVIIKKVRRYIPNDELINDLLAVSRSLGRSIVSTRSYDRHGSFNSSTLITRFGSWTNAIIEAGLMPVKTRKPSKTELLNNMLDVWHALGRQPRLTDMTLQISAYSRTVYIKGFGSWMNALEELEKHLPQTTPHCSGKASAVLSPPYKGGEQKSLPQTTLIPKLQFGNQKPGNSSVPKQEFGNEKKSVASPRAPSTRLRMAVMKRDKFKCVLCGRTPANDSAAALEIDHIIPWSKGGQTVIENLQTLCNECNNGKSDN